MAAPAEPQKKPRSSLKLRIESAAVLIPIVVGAIILGHPAWDLMVVLFGGVMIWEWCRIAARSRPALEQGRLAVLFTAVLFMLIGLVCFAFRDQLPPAARVLGEPLKFVPVAAVAVIFGGLPHFRAAALWFGLGFVYVAVPCIAIIALRADPAIGLAQIFWIVALVIAADTGAYVAGRSIGGPKLAPRVSPNKTWAGLGGAVVSAAIVGVVMALVLDRPTVWTLAGVSAGLAVIEQVGDLAESAFKRRFGVKDASNIIPGHGGALDRVDGLIAVAAAVAGLNAWIGSSVLTWL